MYNYFFARTEPNIVAGDKLSPGTKPGFLKSEKILSLPILYTPKVYQKICL